MKCFYCLFSKSRGREEIDPNYFKKGYIRSYQKNLLYMYSTYPNKDLRLSKFFYHFIQKSTFLKQNLFNTLKVILRISYRFPYSFN